jgi:hypothetical protein
MSTLETSNCGPDDPFQDVPNSTGIKAGADAMSKLLVFNATPRAFLKAVALAAMSV